MKSKVHNIDCVEFMRILPTKYFDLAIVDPPYGIGEDGRNNHTRNKLAKAKDYRDKSKYDNMPPDTDYFIELKRVSKNQIIFGGNHFVSKIPDADSPCWIIWDKDNSGDFADFEMAYTSFKTSARKFVYRWNGMLQANMKDKEERIHPNHKPIALYTWLLQNYAKQGDTIFDSHMGSQSSRIAAHDMGFDYVGCELDKDYFKAGNERFLNHISKQKLFTPQQLTVTQTKLI